MDVIASGAPESEYRELQEQLYRRQFLAMSEVQRSAWELQAAARQAESGVQTTMTATMDRGRAAGWRGDRIRRSLEWLSGGDAVDLATDVAAGAEIGGVLPGVGAENLNRTAVSAAADAVPSGAPRVAETFGDAFRAVAKNKWARWGAVGVGAMGLIAAARSSSTPQSPTPMLRPGGNSAPLPPRPILHQPMDGANPGAYANIPPTARIERVAGQRRYFPGSPPSPRMPNAAVMQPGGVPATPSQALALRRAELEAQGYNRDF